MNWPFDEPINRAAVTTTQLVSNGCSVLLVTHEFEEGRQTGAAEHGLDVSHDCAFERDPSIGEFADLPLAATPWREVPGEPWKRQSKCHKAKE